MTYRELWILCWLYDDMRTSDHDIKYATELLDRDRQRLKTDEAGNKTKLAIENMNANLARQLENVKNAALFGMSQIYDAIEDNTATLEKMDKHQQIAGAIDVAQRRKLNKSVNEINLLLRKND